MARQPFHMVEPSPWPILGGLSGLLVTSGLAAWMHGYGILLLSVALITTMLTMIQWWRDVVREGSFLGHHTAVVTKGLRWGMILFITSEVMFFFAFFWTFWHTSLSPALATGVQWPPAGITPVNPFSVPLLNTAVLLASGVTVTWAHHSLMEGSRREAMEALFITVALGMYFTYLQAEEYGEAPFTIADSIYGTTFFVTTGFHGLHVLIGSTFLLVCLLRVIFHQFSSTHHFGFEAAAWYWHFVDVVWICLYIDMYHWNSNALWS
uniref:cytochrome c oxidase subunit III n=1 Tax=Pseudopotamilla reniformis TaxID=279639 RepID=UPI001FAF39E0|nr:cytochrome c oxidase subunit III [Pseudopotamilla reniformis]ULD67133.1 cytochrome c oxidase subunit III [Pseudopotamilla reniformis]